MYTYVYICILKIAEHANYMYTCFSLDYLEIVKILKILNIYKIVR